MFMGNMIKAHNRARKLKRLISALKQKVTLSLRIEKDGTEVRKMRQT